MWKRAWLFILFLLLANTSLQATTVVVTAGSGGNFFVPAYFTINPGDTVKWIWVNGHHNCSATYLPTGAATWYGNLMTITDTVTYIPTISGLYNYTCTHHSGMDGQFFVTGCSFPAKPIITGINTACKGDTILLSTTAQTGVSYIWLLGSTALSSTGNTCKATIPGNYKVIVNRCGMDSASAVFNLYIDTAKPSFTYSHTGLSYSFTNTTNPVGIYNYKWLFSDGSPIQTTINAIHIFPTPGIYTASLIANSIATTCADTTTDTIHAPLSIGNTTFTNNSIYPNPASAIVHIPEIVSAVLLTDVLGIQYVLQPQYNGRETLINVANLPSGIYNLQVQSASTMLHILH